MPGGVIRVNTSDGREYEVDEDKFAEFEQRATARGIEFTAVQGQQALPKLRGNLPGASDVASGSAAPARPVEQPEPRVRAGAGGASGSWEPSEPPASPLARLGGMFQGAADTVDDTVRGFNRGASLGYGDRAIAQLSDDPDAELGRLDAAQQQAEERSPYAYGTARAVGSLLPAAAAFRLAGPRGAAGAIAASGLVGAAQGAGESRAPDAMGRLEDTAEGANIGLGFGALGEGMGALARLGWQKAAPWIERAARNQSYGGTKPQLQAIAEREGLEAVGDVSASADRLGLTKGFRPRSPETKALEAEQVAKTQGAARLQALQDAGEQGVTVPRETLDAALQSRQGAAAGKMNLGAEPTANAYARARELLPADEQLSPLQVDRLRRDMYEGAGLGRGEVVTAGEAPAKQAQLGVAREARGQLHGAMREQALPETEYQFFNANQDVQDASTLGALAKDRALRISAQAPTSFGRMAGLAAGAMSGAGTGYGASPSLAGAAFGGAVGGAVGFGTSKAAQMYGPDILANTARDVASPLLRLGEGLSRSAALPATTAVTGQRDQAAPSPAPAIMQELQAGGDRLGPYRDAFAKAAASPAPGAVEALYRQLLEQDPNFASVALGLQEGE